MKAAFINQTGAPETIQYGELPDPVCGDNDVLVRVKASSVNPIDTYIRAGVVAMATKFPYVPGCDVAGVVEAIGGSVTRFKKRRPRLGKQPEPVRPAGRLRGIAGGGPGLAVQVGREAIG